MRVGILLLTVVGASQALLIVFLADAGAQTDAFLGSYAIYAPLAALGVSLRITAIPILARSHRRAVGVLRRDLVGAAVAITALIALSSFLLPTTGDARTARVVLLILAPAAGLQFFAGGMAALANSRRRFTASMAVYVGSAFVGLGLSASLLPVIGVEGAALALLSSAVLLASLQTSLAMAAIKRDQSSVASPHTGRSETITSIGAGAALPLSQQLGLIIALRFVAEAPGAATAYSYAFYIVGLLLNVCVLPLALVSLPDLVDAIQRRGARAVDEHLLVVVPALFIALLPLVVTFVAFGEPVVSSVFGGALGADATASLWSAAAALVPFTVGAGLIALCNAALLAERRPKAAALIALGATITYVLAFAVLPGDGSPQSVAWQHSGATGVIALICWVAVVRKRLWRLLPQLLVRCAAGGVVLVMSVVPPAVLFKSAEPVANLAVALVCLAVYSAALMACARGLRGRGHGWLWTVDRRGAPR